MRGSKIVPLLAALALAGGEIWFGLTPPAAVNVLIFALLALLALPVDTPVSYTHLDVYKRQEVPVIELFSDKCAVELLPYGASVRAIRVPDRTDKLTDICLGYDELES